MRTFTFDVTWVGLTPRVYHIDAEEVNEAWEQLIIEVVRDSDNSWAGSQYVESVQLRDER